MAHCCLHLRPSELLPSRERVEPGPSLFSSAGPGPAHSTRRSVPEGPDLGRQRSHVAGPAVSQVHSLGHGPGCCCQGLGRQRKEVPAGCHKLMCSHIITHTSGTARPVGTGWPAGPRTEALGSHWVWPRAREWSGRSLESQSPTRVANRCSPRLAVSQTTCNCSITLKSVRVS